MELRYPTCESVLKNDYQFRISGGFAAESEILWLHQALNELVFLGGRNPTLLTSV